MTIVLLIVLIVANGLFVMAELAVLSSRKSRLQQSAVRGNRHAAAALALAESPSRFLSTTQIGITLISIGLGALGEAALAEDLTHWLTKTFIPNRPEFHGYAQISASAVIVIGVAYVSLVLGELVPKRLALLFPERLASWTAQPMGFISRLTSPVVWVITVTSDAIFGVFGIKDRTESDVTEEDIKGLVVEAAEAGALHKQEQEIVERAFRLGDRRVKALMVPRTDIEWIDADAAPERVRVAVATSYHSHFPVAKGSLDHVLGIVHVKDIIKHGLISDAINLGELVRPPLFVPEATPAYKLLDTFQKSGNHVALVVDEYGALRGLVTLNDIVESLIGEISPPSSKSDMMAVQRKDGSWLLDGSLPADELHRILVEQSPGLEFVRDADVATVGGLVMAELGHIPHEGEIFDRDGFRYEVMDMDGQRVDKVLVSKIEPPPESKPKT